MRTRIPKVFSWSVNFLLDSTYTESVSRIIGISVGNKNNVCFSCYLLVTLVTHRVNMHHMNMCQHEKKFLFKSACKKELKASCVNNIMDLWRKQNDCNQLFFIELRCSLQSSVWMVRIIFPPKPRKFICLFKITITNDTR